MEEKKDSGISRRDFLKGAAAGAAGVAVVGALGACENPTTTEYEYVYKDMDAEGAAKQWKFEIPPEPIADSKISETITHDFVVVGSGMSGLCTAVALAEEGKDVILVSAGRGAVSRGGSNHAIGSNYQTKLLAKSNIQKGTSYPSPYTPQDAAPYIQTEQLAGTYMMDKIKWSRWVKHSGKSMDWMISQMAQSSLKLKVCLELPYPDADGHLNNPPSTHNFYNKDTTSATAFLYGAPQCASAYAERFTQGYGKTIHFETKALQLVRGTDNKSGKVSAVICEDIATGAYKKYVANKAVILATGDFSRDRDMMAKYAPWAYEQFKDVIRFDEGPAYDKGLDFFGMNGLMDGHGQKMGLWVGAAWQKVFPNAAMINMGVSGPNFAIIDNFRGINLNINGKRFHNENTNFGFAAYSKLNQPEKTAYGVWAESYADQQQEWEVSGCTFMSDMAYDANCGGTGPGVTPQTPNGLYTIPQPQSPAELKASWEAGTHDMQYGDMVFPAQYATGSTLDELLDNAIAKGWKINKEEAKRSIERYNQFAKDGEDKEFQVNPAYLKTLLEPGDGKLYMSRSAADSSFLCVSGGLRTDEHMQVCDADDKPIEGLYNTGTMIGDFFAGAYNFGLSGQNLGALCLTLSWILGKELAGLSETQLENFSVSDSPQVSAM
jgi:succinate dehydrogenase/fumarate reductase flavoprotein subunit